MTGAHRTQPTVPRPPVFVGMALAALLCGVFWAATVGVFTGPGVALLVGGIVTPICLLGIAWCGVEVVEHRGRILRPWDYVSCDDALVGHSCAGCGGTADL